MIIININPDERRPSQSRNAVGEIDGEDNGLHALDWHTLSHLHDGGQNDDGRENEKINISSS